MMTTQLQQFILDKVSLSEEECAEVLSFYKPMELSRHQILLSEGEPSRKMYFVVNGCLRVFFIKEDGSEVTRRIVFENAFSTTLVGFITGKPSLEYTQALEPTSLCYITQEDFYGLLARIPKWETFYRKYLETAYVTNTNRLMSFITQDAGERYKSLLAEAPEIIQRLPNRIVASYLNVSPETLSRLKSRRAP
jgi:CRP-like cAMP-binding protein